MSELPRRVSQGDRLTAHWLNRLLDFLRARELRAGPGIKLTRTPSGTTISARRRPGSDGESIPDACVGVVLSNAFEGGLIVKAYPNGILGSESLNVRLHAPCVFRRAPFVPGDVVICHACDVAVTADTEGS